MTGMVVARVGLMSGGPATAFVARNRFPLILTGSLLPVRKVVRFITVTPFRTLIFLYLWTTVRLMVVAAMFALHGP